MNRRVVLGAAAGGAVVAGLPTAAVAAAASPKTDIASAAMIAAWVQVRPEAGATVRLASFDAGKRPLHEWPAVSLEANGKTPASLWRQVQDAGAFAQTLMVFTMARAWNVPPADCEIRTGAVAHPKSGRAMKHAVWVDIV